MVCRKKEPLYKALAQSSALIAQSCLLCLGRAFSFHEVEKKFLIPFGSQERRFGYSEKVQP